MTAVLTGMRTSEFRGLVWEAIDFSRRNIRIRQRADLFSALGATKSRTSRREIPMDATIDVELLRWQDRCPKGKTGWSPQWSGQDRLSPEYLQSHVQTPHDRMRLINRTEVWRESRERPCRIGAVHT